MNGNNRFSFKSSADLWKMIVTAVLASVLSVGGYKVTTPSNGLTGNNAVDIAVMNEKVRQNRSDIDSNYKKLSDNFKQLNERIDDLVKSVVELQVLIKEMRSESNDYHSSRRK